MERETKGSWLSSFVAILYYEFLWNLRKKKTVGILAVVLAITTLTLALPPILAQASGQTFQKEPSFVIDSVTILQPSLLIFILALATTMNTISGEFESGSIIPLLTKPVSRTVIFLGKMLVAFLTLLGAFAFRAVYTLAGGLLVHGPQENLHLVPLGVLGLTVAAMVWVAIVIFFGSLSKNSIVAALGSFGTLLGLAIAGGLVASFLGQTWILFYGPGYGPQGSTGTCEFTGFGGSQMGTGTDALGLLLVQWVLTPGLILNFCGVRFGGQGPPEPFFISSEPISATLLRTVGVSFFYIVALLAVSWFAFRRTQVLE
jgi:ABC-type transport system involved in multi-copper enzyme maturation permease subunit